MHLFKRGIQTITIWLLLIQLTIWTPFFASIANEIFDQDKIIENIEPTENTIMNQDTIETFPVSTIDIETGATTVTYSENQELANKINTDTGSVFNLEDESISTGNDTTLTGNTTAIQHANTWDIQQISDTTTTGDTQTGTIKPNDIEPILTIETPKKSTIITSGLIDQTSIQSYNVIDQNSEMTYCSYITYLNLQNITKLPDDKFIRWNAVDIRTQNIRNQTIAGTGEKIFTGVNLSGTAFIAHLEQLYAINGTSLFDIITNKPKHNSDTTSWPTLDQSHRFVVFLGTDHEWYVLDPVRTLSSEPIFLTRYLESDIFDKEKISILNQYNLNTDEYNLDTDHTTIENSQLAINDIATSTGTSEHTGNIVIHSPMEFLPYVLQGLITSTTSGELISNEIIFHTWFRYETISWDLSAYIPAGLIIKTADLKDFNVSLLNINEIENPTTGDKLMAAYNSSFQFGISGQHLIFSTPVAITVQTPDRDDGDILELMVQHDWQERNKQGLTNNATAICNTDGSVSKEDQGFTSTVRHGQITFYTCGASSFTVNSVWGIAGSNDLQIIIGDYGQIQIYYDGLAQIYGWNPPSAGGASTPTWPILRVGNTNVWPGGTARTSANTTGSQVGNLYTAKTTLSYTASSRTYQVIIDWSYTAPQKKFTQSYTWIIPSNVNQNIRWYYGVDAYVAGADANDVWYYTWGTNPTVGIYDNVADIFLGQKYITGQLWSSYVATDYSTTRTQTYAGSDYTNVITTTAGDLSFWTNWNFWKVAGTYTATIERPLKPYVDTNDVDIIPGIGQPQWDLSVGTVSNIPITVTNVGNLTSSWNHQAILTLPTNISWPSYAFVSSGWNCGAQIGTTVTCNTTTTIWSNVYESFVIPVTPTLAASGTNPSFSVTIANSGDSNITNNTATVLTQNAVTLGSFANSTKLWLKASSLTTIADWGSIPSRTNFWSKSAATQTTSTAQPTLRKKTTTNLVDNINFNPVVSFNGSSQYMTVTGWLLGSDTLWDAYVYVISSSQAKAQLLFQENDASPYSCPRFSVHAPWTNNNLYRDAGDCSSNSRLFTSRWAVDNKPYLWTLSKSTTNTAQNVAQDIRRNGLTIATKSTTQNIVGNNSDFFLWSSQGTTNFATGQIAEMIIYAGNGGIIDLTQQNKIESYLSIKYGMSLDQSAIGWQNYTLNNGALSWSATTAGTYKNDIAWIVRDDSIGLLQNKSQSINNIGDIIVETATTPTNLSSMIWANNGWSTGFSASEIPATGISQRITRERQIQEKNSDAGSVTITYPISTGLLANGNLTLLVDNDGDFSNGGTTLVTWAIVWWYWQFSTNINDGQYITLGIATNTTAGTLCIQSPTTISLWSGVTKSIDQQIDTLTTYFSVEDLKWSASGYYTTLSISALTGANGLTIPASAIQIKANTVTTLSGTSNASVILDPSINSYIAANTPIQFIKRNNNTWQSIVWTYGSQLRIRINVPAYQSVGSYSGTITYTLYEN